MIEQNNPHTLAAPCRSKGPTVTDKELPLADMGPLNPPTTPATQALLPVTQDRLIYVRWSDDGQHIRKWAREPFEGATAFANAGNGAPLGPFDADDHYPAKDLPFALRSIAENIHVQCADHVLEDMVRIVTDAASVIEASQAHSLPGDVGTTLQKAQWLNLMPREIVARAALNEGCRDKTASDIRSGLHSDVKIRAEVAVKLIGLIQAECFAALTTSPCLGDVGVFDIEPTIGECSPEPSLRRIVRGYYNQHFNAVRAEELTEQYFAALTPSALSGDAGEGDYSEQALADGCIDFLEERADAWMEDEGVQRMFNAIASVFEAHAPQEIMDRFRTQLGVIGRQCHVEGALRVWEEIAAQQRALGRPLPVRPDALPSHKGAGE